MLVRLMAKLPYLAVILAVLFAAPLLVSPKIEASSNTLNFQSKIVFKTSGMNITSGSSVPSCITSGADTCDFQMRFYTVSTAGSAIYTETFANVEIGDTNGIFNLVLNSVCAATPSGNYNWGAKSVTNCSIPTGVDFSQDLFYEFSFDPNGNGDFAEGENFPGSGTRPALRRVPSAYYAQVAGTVTSDSLDYDDFEDTMDLDSNLTLNQGTNIWTQSFTGTTTTGLTLNTNSLTSGTGLTVSSSATAFTGNLQTISLTGNNVANTGDLLELSISGTSSAARGLYINNLGTGLSFRIDDSAGDTTPFTVDNSGNVSVGGNITTSITSIDLLNTTATTINFGGAASTLNIGPGSTTATSINFAGGSGATGCTIDGATGNFSCSGTISGSFSVADDSLDFDKFEDTLDLDNNLTLNQGTNTWTQSFTGTSTIGTYYQANSVTGGSALRIDTDDLTVGRALYLKSSSANLSGSMFYIENNVASASNTGSLARLWIGGNLSNLTGLRVDNRGSGYSLYIEDESSDTTPFSIDASGNVAIGGTITTAGNIITSLTSIDLINTTATTINFGGAASALNIGPGSTTATSINFAGGSGATGCTIDGATGNITCSGDGAINGDDLTTTQTGTFNLINTNATALNIGGAVTGSLALAGGSGSTGCTITGNTGAFACSSSGTFSTSLIAGTTSFDLINTTATTINFGNAATTFNIGQATSATLNIGAGSTTATTINFAGGSGATGCTITGATGVFGCSSSGTFGTSLIASTSSFDLINTTASTINFGNAATTFNIGQATSATLNIGAGSTTATTINFAGGSGATGCTISGATGNLACSGTITGTFTIPDNSLDFNKLDNTLDLDNNLTLNQTAFTWSQSFTGTTTTGYTYTANSLTSGTAQALTSSSTNFTGNLQTISLSGNNVNNTGDVLELAITGSATNAQALYINNQGKGKSIDISHTITAPGTASGKTIELISNIVGDSDSGFGGVYVPHYGFKSTITGNPGVSPNSQDYLFGGSFNSYKTGGSGTVLSTVGIEANAGSADTASGSITEAVGLNTTIVQHSTGSLGTAIGIRVGSTVRSQGSIGSNFGLRIEAQTVTATHSYGLYIGAVSGASTTNYSLYVDGGTSLINGRLGLAFVNGSAASPTLFAASEPSSGFFSNSAGNINLSIKGTETIRWNSSGTRLMVIGSATATHVCMSGTGVLSSCSSSIRYKTNVQDLAMGLPEIMNLRPVSYDWKAEYNNPNHDIGFVAEEIALISPNLVTYRDGVIEGVKYDLLTALLARGIQQQQGQLDELDANSSQLTIDMDTINIKLANLTSSLDTQKLRIDDIDSRLSTIESNLALIQSYTLPSTASFEELIVSGKIEIEGLLLLSNKNIGTSKIEVGDVEVAITFATPFPVKPVVIATPVNTFAGFKVKDITQEGFKIELASAATEDIEFNWFVSSVNE